jgi:hypothetical protein
MRAMNLAAAMLSGVYSATRIKSDRSRGSRSKPVLGERRKIETSASIEGSTNATRQNASKNRSVQGSRLQAEEW